MTFMQGRMDDLIQAAASVVTCSGDEDELEKSVAALHDLLFVVPEGDVATTKSLKQRVSELLGTHFPTFKKAQKRRPGGIPALLVETLCVLAHLLLSAADDSDEGTMQDIVNRLTGYLLPIVFMRTRLTPLILRDTALRSPWAEFARAFQAKTGGVKSERIRPRLRDALQDLSVNFGCDFLYDRQRGSALKTSDVTTKTIAPTAPHSSTLEAWSQNLRGGSDHVNEAGAETSVPAPETALPMVTPGRPLSTCLSWSAVVQKRPSTADKRTSSHGIPFYLLTKRRTLKGAEPASASAGMWTGETGGRLAREDTEGYGGNTRLRGFIDEVSEDSNSILALESPVKRRRLDTSAVVPPSPDRMNDS